MSNKSTTRPAPAPLTDAELAARAEYHRLCDRSDAVRDVMYERALELVTRYLRALERDTRLTPRQQIEIERGGDRIVVRFGTAVRLTVSVPVHTATQVRAEAPATIVCKASTSSMGDLSLDDAQAQGQAMLDAVTLARTITALLA